MFNNNQKYAFIFIIIMKLLLQKEKPNPKWKNNIGEIENCIFEIS